MKTFKEYKVRRGAMTHKNITAEHVATAFKDSQYNLRIKALMHPKATKEIVQQGLDDRSKVVRRVAESQMRRRQMTQ